MTLEKLTIKVVAQTMPSNKNIINIDRWWKYNERCQPKWYSIKCYFQKPCFTTLWLNGQFKYQMPYEDTTIWTCVATSNFTKLHYGINHIAPTRLNMYLLLSKYALGDKFQGASDQW